MWKDWSFTPDEYKFKVKQYISGLNLFNSVIFPTEAYNQVI